MLFMFDSYTSVIHVGPLLFMMDSYTAVVHVG